MNTVGKAFEVTRNGKPLDYRLGKTLKLKEISAFFQRDYKVMKVWNGGRHVLGVLKQDNHELFLKLATSEGIGVVTQSEYEWNEAFNNQVVRADSKFWVPKNVTSGFYNDLFYSITDMFEGSLLAPRPEKEVDVSKIKSLLDTIIEFSELIQTLNLEKVSNPEGLSADFRERFIQKTTLWYNAIPDEVKGKFELKSLLEVVTQGSVSLRQAARHGDFTPWHIMELSNGCLGLLDGEHAIQNGVEYYDMCYFIQRVFSVIKNPEFAKELYNVLLERGYDKSKMQTVLASRAIGGFLDESLVSDPDYSYAEEFKGWVFSL